MEETITFHFKVVDNLTPAIAAAEKAIVNSEATVNNYANSNKAVVESLRAVLEETKAVRESVANLVDAQRETTQSVREFQGAVETAADALALQRAATGRVIEAEVVHEETLDRETDALASVRDYTVSYAEAGLLAATAVEGGVAANRDFSGALKAVAASLAGGVATLAAFADAQFFLEQSVKLTAKGLVFFVGSAKAIGEAPARAFAAVSRAVLAVTESVEAVAVRLGLFKRQIMGVADASGRFVGSIGPTGPLLKSMKVALAGVADGFAKSSAWMGKATLGIAKFLAKGYLIGQVVSIAIKAGRALLNLAKEGIELGRGIRYAEAQITAMVGSSEAAAKAIGAVSAAARAGAPFGREEMQEAVKVLVRFGLESLATKQGLLSLAGAAIKSDESMAQIAIQIGHVVTALRLAADGSDESRRLVAQAVQPMVEMGTVSTDTAAALVDLTGAEQAVSRATEILASDLNAHTDVVRDVASTYVGLGHRIDASWDELAVRVGARFGNFSRLWRVFKLETLAGAHALLDFAGAFKDAIIHLPGELYKLVSPWHKIKVATEEATAAGAGAFAMARESAPAFDAQAGALGAVELSARELSSVYEQLDQDYQTLNAQSEAVARFREEIQGLPTQQMVADFEALRIAWDSLDPDERAANMGNYSEMLYQASEAGHELTAAEVRLADAHERATATSQPRSREAYLAEQADRAAATAAAEYAQSIDDLGQAIQGLPTARMAEDMAKLREAWAGLTLDEQNASLMRYGELLAQAADEGHRLTGDEQNLAGTFLLVEENAERAAEALVINTAATRESAREAEYAARMQEAHAEKIADLAAELQGMATSRVVEQTQNLREAWNSLDPAAQAQSMETYAESLRKVAEQGAVLSQEERNIVLVSDQQAEAALQVMDKLGEDASSRLEEAFYRQEVGRKVGLDIEMGLGEGLAKIIDNIQDPLDMIAYMITWTMIKGIQKVGQWFAKLFGWVDKAAERAQKAWDWLDEQWERDRQNAYEAGYTMPGAKPSSNRGGRSTGTRQGGSFGYENFGSGATATLHGMEAVVPQAGAGALARDIADAMVGPMRSIVAGIAASGGGFGSPAPAGPSQVRATINMDSRAIMDVVVPAISEYVSERQP